VVKHFHRLALLVLTLAAPACNFSLTDYPYCFECQTSTDCQLGTVCADGFCRYPCDAGSCAVGSSSCRSDGFCHALDDGGC
jgi:hypothetical protein